MVKSFRVAVIYSIICIIDIFTFLTIWCVLHLSWRNGQKSSSLFPISFTLLRKYTPFFYFGRFPLLCLKKDATTSHSYELDIRSQAQKTTSLSYAVISSGVLLLLASAFLCIDPGWLYFLTFSTIPISTFSYLCFTRWWCRTLGQGTFRRPLLYIEGE